MIAMTVMSTSLRRICMSLLDVLSLKRFTTCKNRSKLEVLYLLPQRRAVDRRDPLSACVFPAAAHQLKHGPAYRMSYPRLLATRAKSIRPRPGIATTKLLRYPLSFSTMSSKNDTPDMSGKQIQPSTPRESASLILLSPLSSPTSDGFDYKVCLLKRNSTMAAAANATVFPGTLIGRSIVPSVCLSQYMQEGTSRKQTKMAQLSSVMETKR